MKQEKQVSNLKYSKILQKLGVKQESIYRWEVAFGGGVTKLIWDNYRKCDCPVYDTADVRQYYSAFTVAELGEMLPAYSPAKLEKKIGFNLRFVKEKHSKVWLVGYKKLYIDDWWKVEEAKTEVKATAELLVYLLKNKLIIL